MDVDRWAELARLTREAKAILEATEPPEQSEIMACDEVIALAEGMVMDGTWTADSDVLAEWLDRAKTVAVAVCSGHDPDERMYLPLDGAEPVKILRGWLAQAPAGGRREAQVKYGANETDSAFVTLRERGARQFADTAEVHGDAEALEPGG